MERKSTNMHQIMACPLTQISESQSWEEKAHTQANGNVK